MVASSVCNKCRRRLNDTCIECWNRSPRKEITSMKISKTNQVTNYCKPTLVAESNKNVLQKKSTTSQHIDVRKIRTQLGLSQAEFAHRFGLQPRVVQNWEQGSQDPDSVTKILLMVIAHKPNEVASIVAMCRLGGHL